jgi:hypothetical protein
VRHDRPPEVDGLAAWPAQWDLDRPSHVAEPIDPAWA